MRELTFLRKIFLVFYPELKIKHVQDDVPTTETRLGKIEKVLP